MANTLSAEKRNRQRIKRRARNLTHLTPMRTKVKRARTALADSKVEQQELTETITAAIKQLARAAAKGVVHKRTASRKISRLTLALNKSATNRNAPSASTPKKAAKATPGKAPAKAAPGKTPAKAPAKAPAKVEEPKATKAATKAPAKAPEKSDDTKAAAKAAKPAARAPKKEK